MDNETLEKLLDQVIQSMSRKSAEAVNSVHACRYGHPLSSGDRVKDIRNAAFTVSANACSALIDKLYIAADRLEKQGEAK